MGKKNKGQFINIIITAGDFICINLVFLLSHFFLSPDLTGPFNQKIVWFTLNVAYIPVNIMFSNVHNNRVTYIDELLLTTTKSIFLYFLIFLSLSMFLQFEIKTKTFVLYFTGLYITLNLWWIIVNRVLKYYRRKGYNFKRVVIVGAGKTGIMLYNELCSDMGYGYKFLGFFDDDETKIPAEIKQYWLGNTEKTEKFCKENSVDEIYCALPGSQDNKIINLIQISERNAIRFYIVPEIRRYVLRRLNFQTLGAIPLFSVREEPLQNWWFRFIKRLMDIIISGTMLLLSPLWYIPIAIAVKRSSPGPVLFRQKRTGLMGKEFECLKFRTMKVNTECDTKQAERGDDRITPIGRFLRKTSLDEFPQFINIFKGEMSVVGPRPHMLKHTKEYSAIIDKYMVRHFIKPGLTGWAQVNGYRGETKDLEQMEMRVKYDIWYIEHWNLLLDIKIILLTIWQVIKGDDNAF